MQKVADIKSEINIKGGMGGEIEEISLTEQNIRTVHCI